MTKSYTKKQLEDKTVAELKDICKANSIRGYSNLSKADLIKFMLKKLKASGSKKSRAKASGSRKSSAKKKGCHLPDGCDTKAKSGYSIAEIRELAKSCNLSVKGKTRKQLCAEIAEALNKSSKGAAPPPPPPPPPPRTSSGSGRKICKAKSGKPYNKSNCSRYGKEKGCVWDNDAEECYQSDEEESKSNTPPPPPSSSGGDEGPAGGRNICKAKSGKPYNKSNCSRYGKEKGCVWDNDAEECYKPSGSGTGSTPPPSPPPSSSEGKESDEEEDCYGGNRVELLEKKLSELKDLLKDAGITKGLPRSKIDAINYLCALGKDNDGGRCDKGNDYYCEGGNVCDAAAGLCIPPEAANRKGMEVRTFNGRKIMGSKSALDKLFKILEKEEKESGGVPPPPPPPFSGEEKTREGEEEDDEEARRREEQAKRAEEEARRAEEEARRAEEEAKSAEENRRRCDDGNYECKTDDWCDTCGDDWECGDDNMCRPREDLPPPPPPPPPSKPREGEPIISIEEILEQLERGGKVDVGEMSAVQREVLTCLGLVSSA